MSKHDFTPEEFSGRTARTRQAIGAAGLDWLLVIHPVSMRWLIGQDTKSYTIFQCLAVSAKPGPLVLFTRGTDRNEYAADTMADEISSYGGGEPADPMEHFSRFAKDRGLLNARVGMEVPGFYLHPHQYVRVKEILGSALVAEPNGLVAGLRAIKSPREIEYTRKAASLSAQALQALIATVAEGRTELELAAAAYHTLLRNGSGLPHSTMNLMTGERSCFALGGPTERRQRRGDTGLVEIGGNFRRYTSTLGRQWSLGKPSARLTELYDIVRAAADACMAEMRAGVAAIVPHEAAKRVIAEAGLDRYRMHTTGYGMAPGFPPSWGEGVNLFGGSKDVLAAGMVVSVEPNIFIAEEKIGVRLIDNLLITETGAELLSTTPRDLIVID
jgi:Xaa-Pro dipeptidase